MSALVAAGRRYLPRGWGDLGRQFLIWFGFLAAYRGVKKFLGVTLIVAITSGLGAWLFEGAHTVGAGASVQVGLAGFSGRAYGFDGSDYASAPSARSTEKRWWGRPCSIPS